MSVEARWRAAALTGVAFCSWELAQKANKWAGGNLARRRNDEYDRLWRTAETEWIRSIARRSSSG